MAPLEPWEKVLIDAEAFLGTTHGQIPCVDCHQGVLDEDKAVAHESLIPDPSENAEEYCASCHPEVTTHATQSLHATLTGYWTVLETRGVPQDHPAAQEMFGNHCASCHASCGDCHVSQPNSVGGGLIEGHLFQKTPSLTRNCTACHGSRVGNEYMGKHEGLKADVHFRQGRMTCVDCHSGQDMHGQFENCQECHPEGQTEAAQPPAHRYQGSQSPSCERCHPQVGSSEDEIVMHTQHGDTLSCQVCHSVAYTSCDGCHVSLSEETGNPIFSTEGSYLGFYIGKNPRQDADRPYQYVPLRHVPISETSFDYYQPGLVSNLSGRPTWVYTTPHNIQRNTPQTESCQACHGNPDVFLTAEDVAPEELEFNLEVIVDPIPPSPFDAGSD